MTVKLVVLYASPADPDNFEREYTNTHMPLVDQVPGLQRVEVGRVLSAFDGKEQALHRVTELYFDDADSMQTALGTEQGRATGKDYARIAPEGSRMYVVEVER